MLMKDHADRKLLKNASPYEIVSSLNKNEGQRERILKQLQQVGLPVAEYEGLPLKDLLLRVEDVMRNTYSIKYLGLNKNQMGIISRRINPLADQNFKIHDNIQDTYSIHKYFYPKPLKTGKKSHSSEKINVDNLQSEIKKQFDQNRAGINKVKENNTHERFRSTKMCGSWVSITKKQTKPLKISSNFQCKANELANSIQPKIDPKKSFSRFLNQGILIIRD